ncbi:MAG: DUF4291 domain-containing protein [Saprospiraceae bacterium]|nr:DUF4291 domain-containing protein [Saprospiraceae bacterium]
MKLRTIPYQDYEKDLPQSGQHILAQQNADAVIVYQAFNPRIASYAAAHQIFGGDHYSYNRMTWIKPNFLWMMYRCGWAMKENQKRVLAIEIAKEHFDEILAGAVHSAFKADKYENVETWQAAVKNSNVRLQWDPDHDPYGCKLERRAIQLGMRGEMQTLFGKEWIRSIEDITDFVLEQGKLVQAKALDQLLVVQEEVYLPNSDRVDLVKLGLD